MKLDEKLEFSRKKFIFHEISRIHQKWSKKSAIFSKKNKIIIIIKLCFVLKSLLFVVN